MADPQQLANILKSIEQFKNELTAHFDARLEIIQQGVNNIQGSMATMCEQINEIQQRVSANEDNLEDLSKRIKSLEKENAHLRDKAEDLENRSRSYNLRFINIPEKKEGKDMIAFMTQLIQQLLGKDHFPTLVIERAHRSPTYMSKTNSARPRTVLVKFLHFQDKVKILRLAREKGELIYLGVKIHIYPDFSAGLVERRREFDAVKNSLQSADIKYSLMYPAKLRVMVGDKPKIFTCPKEAESFFSHLHPSPAVSFSSSQASSFSSSPA